MKFFRDVLIIAGMTLILLVVMEGALRIIYPHSLKSAEDSLYTFNSRCWYTLKPGQEEVFQRSEHNGGDSICWRSNSDGFRGEELKENPDFRIIVYGDSNIQARFSSLENTFCFKLQSLLMEKSDMDVEVINAGIIGHGPDQYLLRFKEHFSLYQPDLAIFHVFADNDYGNAIRNRLLEVDSTGRLALTFHENVHDCLLPGQTESKERLLLVKAAKRVKGKINQTLNPKSTETVISFLEQSCAQDYANYKNGGPLCRRPNTSHYDIDLATNPQGLASQAKLVLMEAIIKEAKEFAASQGAVFMVQIHPSSIDLTGNYRWVDCTDLSRFAHYKPDNLTRFLESICQRHQISHVNFFHVFKQHDPNRLFFRHDDNHWNDEGQALAAKVSADFIAQEMMKDP